MFSTSRSPHFECDGHEHGMCRTTPTYGNASFVEAVLLTATTDRWNFVSFRLLQLDGRTQTFRLIARDL